MSPLRQTSRLLAVLTICALLAATGCSSADASFEGADAGDTYISQGGDGDGDPTGTEGGETGPADTGETDTGDDGDELGPEDPELALELCDPFAPQVIAYGLEHARAEATPTLVRESVLYGDGSVPPIPLSARPFLNHYDYDYPPAEGWDPQINGELWQPPMVNGEAPPRYRLQYAVLGPQIDAAQRPKVDLAVVVDLGAAMAGEPLELAEEALAALESALLPGDRVTLIAAGAEPLLLGTTTIDNLGLTPLTGLLAEQDPTGPGDVATALGLAYDIVAEEWVGQGQSRVLLISNGHFEGVGEGGVVGDPLVELVEEQAGEGRYLLSVGVGDPMQFDAATIDALAREGRGVSLFARNPDELWAALQQDFSANLIAVARDVEVTLTLPAGLAVRERDPFSGKVSEPELAMLGPNGALVFHHELEACGELALDAMIRVELQWTDPLDPPDSEAKQLVWEQPLSGLSEASLRGQKGAATVAYARALRAFRDGGDPAESYGAVLDAISHISDALEALPEDADLIEMSSVIAALSG